MTTFDERSNVYLWCTRLTTGSDFVFYLHNDWSDVLAFADPFIFANDLKL